MNLSLNEAEDLAQGIIHFIKETSSPTSCYFIAPPFPFLDRLQTLILSQKSSLLLVAQDVSAHEKGAFTGEVSALHLKEFGVKGVLIGHSERRHYHQEKTNLLQQKTSQCLSNDLIPILCLGENLQTRETLNTISFVLNQLQEMCLPFQENIKSLPSPSLLPPLMIAYEPLWAIGTGHVPSLDEIREVHKNLKNALKSLFPNHNIPLLYGGSVTDKNIFDILKLSDVDGALIGGASLSLKTFLPLLKETRR